jgi:transposase-like protein
MINKSKILELVKSQKDTGLTITAFCSNEGIPKSSFYYWRKKLNKEPGKHFIPLLVNSRPAPMTLPANESYNPDKDFLLELIYPNGTRLRIKSDPDLNHLRSLICLLG